MQSDVTAPSRHSSLQRQVMRQQESGHAGPLGPLDWLRIIPHETAASSHQLEWAGLEAARCREVPPFEFNLPALTHHRLFLFARPPEELELLYEGVQRRVPPPTGSILLLPAGCPARVRSSGCKDELHVFLEPGLVGRVAAEAFGLDPARVAVRPLDAPNLPRLRGAMLAVQDELTDGGAGGRLASEWLANLLAVHLIRDALSPRRPAHGTGGALPQAKLRAVIEYVEENLDAGLTLQQMAAAAHLSTYHFARQFKAAVGMPPHQYVISRRIERAQHLLQPSHDLSLSEIATRTGFADQSHFSNHFKRIVGITPRQFRASAGIA